jgi:hypothetical protein
LNRRSPFFKPAGGHSKAKRYDNHKLELPVLVHFSLYVLKKGMQGNYLSLRTPFPHCLLGST